MPAVKDDPDILASRAVEPTFYRAPYPAGNEKYVLKEYQHAGVEYCLIRDHALIGDAPGVGKTAQGICLSNAIEARHTLVVCPASLRLNWEREIWVWSMLPNVSTYPVLKATDGVNLDAGYVVISYDLLRNEHILAALMQQRWDHVILDEAHYLKDPKGNRRTKAILGWHQDGDYVPGVCDVAGRVTLLSGTILPNQPIEVYNAARLLNWDAIDRMSLEDFRESYYDLGGGMVRGPVFDAKRQVWSNKLHWSDRVRNVPKNLEDLQYRLRKHVMVRRLKEQVLHELPAKQWHPFPLATTPEMRKALRHPGWAEAEKLYELDPDAFNRGIPVDGAVSTARRLLGEAKAPAVASYIEDLLDSGVRKIVVAAWHHTVLAVLKDRLARYGLVYMDGGTSAKNKQLAADRFQSDEKVRLILGQNSVIGLGHTLTEAQDVVFAEFDWVPGPNDQVLDRIHRYGQKGAYVLGHVPVVPGTLDERLLGTAIEKDQHIFAALDKR